MGEYDDNDAHAAYERARDHSATFIEFANIVQHYDDNGTADHDNIDYTADDIDGAEYDHHGNRVEPIDFDIIDHIVLAVYEYDGFDNIPEDYDFNSGAVYHVHLGVQACGHNPSVHRFFKRYASPGSFGSFFDRDGNIYRPGFPDAD